MPANMYLLLYTGLYLASSSVHRQLNAWVTF